MTVWAEGGKALAREIVRLCEEEKGDFTFSYDLDCSIEEKIESVVKKVYGGDGITVMPNAKKHIDQLTALGYDKVPAAERIDVDENGKITGLF